MWARLGSGKCGISEIEYTGKCEIMGMSEKRPEIFMTAVLVFENVWYEEATFPSTGTVPIRIFPGCNTGLNHNYILDGRNASEVNIFEIKLSVCALTHFTMTEYH